MGEPAKPSELPDTFLITWRLTSSGPSLSDIVTQLPLENLTGEERLVLTSGADLIDFRGRLYKKELEMVTANEKVSGMPGPVRAIAYKYAPPPNIIVFTPGKP